MKVLVEINDKNDLIKMLWSGAIDTINSITNNEAKTILDILEDSYVDKFLKNLFGGKYSFISGINVEPSNPV